HPSLVNDAVNLALTRVEYAGAPPAVQANVKALKHERVHPAYLTHALLDTTELWDAPTKAGPWLPDSKPAVGAPGELDITPDEARLRFERLKRQHYFEAEYGDK
nr:hypothetical protein [Tanacetum cinerariifolium]